ncbi:MAG: hypothetical protein ACYC3I_15310 [Gemmataceae bacterium]
MSRVRPIPKLTRVCGFTSVRRLMYASVNAASVVSSRAAIKPTLANLSARSTPIPVSHDAVSRSTGVFVILAFKSASTRNLTDSAVRLGTAPKRRLFLFWSTSTNWIVALPFENEILAIGLVPFS